MNSSHPLVTIGIPTYNRAAMLRRSIESALHQDYPMIEVIISDNASTDSTKDICQEFSRQDVRVNCIKQAVNIGATANFAEVLRKASGDYFMWLGDDDWIDVPYVSSCMSLLMADSSLSLVSGAPIYYRHGSKIYAGKKFDLLEQCWVIRVANYYRKVADNGMFYGVMRTTQLQQLTMPNVMGGDWHLIAGITSMGKVRMISAVSVHRELGGASTNLRQIAKSLGLPRVQAMFPMITIVSGAWKSIVFDGAAYKNRSIIGRIVLAWVVVIIIGLKPISFYLSVAKRFVKRWMCRMKP